MSNLESDTETSNPSDHSAVEQPKPIRKEPAERLVLRGKPRPVTRLSRTTLVILVGGLTITVFAAGLWGLRKPHKTAAPADELRNVEHVSRAEGLDTLPADYASLPQPKTSPVPHLGAPVGELGRPVLREEEAAGIPPLPERSSFAPSPEEDAIRTERLKDHQEDDAAIKSSVFVQLKQRAHGQADSVTSTSESNLNRVGSSAVEVTSPSRPFNPTSVQEHKEAFLSGGANTDSQTYAAGALQTPRSPAQLMAGSIIPAAMMTGIDSDLPGEIEAQVTSAVYDSVTGRLLLIPQGARLLGQYDSQVSYGQRRVLLVWTRLIMPDGSSIVLDRLPGADVVGQAGLEDRVDWHGSRIAAGAALSTMLNIATELAAPNQAATNGSGLVVIGARQGVQDSLNQVAQEITRRNLDVQPTLTIRPGFPVRVLVQKDLVLQPYREPGVAGTQSTLASRD